MGYELPVRVSLNDQEASYGMSEALAATLRLRRRVIFACQRTKWSISAMLKAAAFANYLGAELFVLHISKCLVGRRKLFWREPPHQSIDRWVRNLSESTARCNHILPGAIPSRNLLIRHGDFVAEVVKAVSELEAGLVVMPADTKGNGQLAMDIANEAKVSVLVARAPRSQNIVLAATDLADGRYPVLHKARQIGGFMGAQMVLFHNVAPMEISVGHAKTDGSIVVLNGENEDQAQARLKSVAHKFPRCIKAVVKKQLNTSHAILTAARECDADLIVLGVKRGASPIERMLGGGVAARVAEQAWRSVLLTPVHASAGL